MNANSDAVYRGSRIPPFPVTIGGNSRLPATLPESQRDSASKPKVARNEPPWDCHGIAERIAGRIREQGLTPREELNDSLVLAESALLGCSLLLTSDEHLRGGRFRASDAGVAGVRCHRACYRDATRDCAEIFQTLILRRASTTRALPAPRSVHRRPIPNPRWGC